MLRLVYANLIGNAIKFTRHTSDPSIEIGAIESETGTIYHVRDNGIGFDMKYADQIFKPFQRLHSKRRVRRVRDRPCNRGADHPASWGEDLGRGQTG